jgi:hypothetical protein
MEKEGKESIRFHQRPKMANLVLIEGYVFPPPWVPGEELDGLATSDLSSFCHLRKAPGNGDMKAKSHLNLLNKRLSEVVCRIYRSVMSCQ